MGFIRGGLLVIASVLFFLSLFALILTGILYSSLQYENFESKAVSVANELLIEKINLTNYTQNISPMIQSYCINNSDYVFSYQGYTFDIPCDKAILGSEFLINEVVKDLIRGIYYSDYDCNFLDCFGKSQTPLFLASEKSYNYLGGKVYLILIISLILLIAIFLLAEKKTNALLLSGILILISSLLFLKLDIWISLISNKMVSQFVGIFFSQAFNVSIKILIIGVLFFISAIIFKMFRVGFFISELIEKLKGKSKEIKKEPIVKKEIKPTKKTKSK
ncbi:hypothetical protein M0R19_01285 [Candidatus Pacearchaeota archaeon]|nr:hypothetical protein [Candidatus Pacearchaeota archaeon]